MVKILITLVIFLVATLLTWGQADTVFIKYNKDKFEEEINYKTDTVIFDTPNARQILYGTTVLPWTRNQQVAKGYGLFLDSVSFAPCQIDYSNLTEMENQIIGVIKGNGSLIIETKYWGNCCHSFLCDIEVNDDNTVNLIVYGYGATYCSCDCCFGLTYHFETMEVDEFKGLKYVSINGDERTRIELK